MDGRTHVCMDGHLRPALLGRLCQRVDLKINLAHFYGQQCIIANNQMWQTQHQMPKECNNPLRWFHEE